MVDKIEAVDPLTVRFTLSSPYSDLAAVTAQYQAQIVSGSAMDTLTTKPIGTGPFRSVEYRPGDQLVVEKNPDYFVPGSPKLDGAVMRTWPIASPLCTMAAFASWVRQPSCWRHRVILILVCC